MNLLRRVVYQLRRRWAARHLATCPDCDGSGVITTMGWDYLQVATCRKCGSAGLVRR